MDVVVQSKEERAACYKAYNQANKERIADKQKAYYQENKERIAAYNQANKERIAARKKTYYQANKEKTAAREKARQGPQKMLYSARERAKRYGRDFNIDLLDIIVPKFCPVLGIPLIYGDGKTSDNSPTLDRIDNNHGYVKGNVAVISHKANSIKRDSTHQEISKLHNFVQSHQPQIFKWLKKSTQNTTSVL